MWTCSELVGTSSPPMSHQNLTSCQNPATLLTPRHLRPSSSLHPRLVPIPAEGIHRKHRRIKHQGVRAIQVKIDDHLIDCMGSRRLRGEECDVCIILNSVCNYLGIGTTIIHCVILIITVCMVSSGCTSPLLYAHVQWLCTWRYSDCSQEIY